MKGTAMQTEDTRDRLLTATELIERVYVRSAELPAAFVTGRLDAYLEVAIKALREAATIAAITKGAHK